MACVSPLRGYLLLTEKTENGKQVIVWNQKDIEGKPYEALEVQCGQCVGCRMAKTQEWATRCVHEASLWCDNCFITLTYRDEDMTDMCQLVKSDYQKFMKRLRKAFKGETVRYFMCGEYGSEHMRPHFHACLFGIDFPDKKLWRVRNGVKLYRSELLEKLWPKGYATVGDVTYESAQYIAKYIHKKMNGKKKEEYYRKLDLDTGELVDIQPEYVCMSRRPGIGAGWIEKWTSDMYPADYVHINGRKVAAPKYYDRYLERTNPELHKKIKARRKKNVRESPNNNPWRRKARERILTQKINNSIREYENE